MGLWKRGRIWWMDYTVDGLRRRESTGQRDKVRARQVYLAKIREIQDGLYDLREPEEITLKDFAPTFLAFAKTNKSTNTYLYYCNMVNNHLVPAFGDKFLSRIRVSDIEQFKANGQSVPLINKSLKTLQHMLNVAVELEYLRKSPLGKVRLIREPEKSFHRFFTEEELERILNLCDQEDYLLFLMATDTGMREQELFNVMWQDIDFKRERIAVTNRADFRTKNLKNRYIPLTPRLKSELMLHKPGPKRCPYVLHYRGEKRGRGGARRTMNTVLDRAGVKEHGVGIHTFRHTFCSHLVMAGVDLRSVQAIMGHSDFRTTLKYAHMAPEHLKDSVERLPFAHKRKEKGKVIRLEGLSQ